MRKQSSFFFKIISSFTIIILILILSIYVFSSYAIKKHYETTLTQNLININKSLIFEIQNYINDKDFDNLNSFIKDIGQQINTRITIISSQGLVLADSKGNPKLMENHRYRPEIEKALSGKTGISIRYSKTLKAKMLYVAMPLLITNKTHYVIRTSLFMGNIKKLRQDLSQKILIISFSVFLFAIISAIILSKSISNPIEKLTTAAKRVSTGDFNTKVFLNRNDDLNILAENFNDMTEEIQNLFEKTKKEKESLNCVISSIDEALMVINLNGNVILTNDNIKKITDKEMFNRPFWEIIRDEKFENFIDKIKKEKINFSEEWFWKNKYFLCSFGYADLNNEIVILFHDITRQKEMEIIKKEFVSNVSHELRTPLTAIKGFVETLEEDEKEKDKLYYLKIIDKHTNRLITIVKDLLILSNLEETETLQKESINLENLIKDQGKIFEKKMIEKSLNFNVNVDKELSDFLGDRFRLEQMFINLIDNAIKYTDHGKIDIQVKNKNTDIQIIVRDTGIGIEKKHYLRLFERFYVTDKSRSRQSGGTGLGLSIVKHIVLLHGGSINVKSEIGKGTKFIINLPKT